MLASFRELSTPSRLLVINQFGINIGFYLVLPFLATYMGSLGFAAATIGLVLALRNLSQQGLFLIGGSAADRIGCRPMIIVGCGLRVVAFALFTVVTSLPGLIVAAMLTGLAGALFNPAVRAYLMAEAGEERRAETFAVFNVFAHAGALVGPLLGAALLAVDFRLVALVALVVFAVLTAAQVLVLPHRETVPQDRGVLGSWGEVLTNRRFLLFALGGSAYFALYNQLYLALPVEAQRVSGVAGAVSAVFVVSTVVGIAGQVRITAWCRRRWSDGRSLATGLVVMGSGFVPLALAAPLLPTAPPGQWSLAGLTATLPVLVGIVVFTIGMAMTNPFTLSLLPVVGSERLVGTYYGFFYLVSAAVVAVVNTGVGGLLDGAGGSWPPFAVLVAVGALGAAVIAAMYRRGALDSSSPTARGAT
ncbi:MFS transporter [Actinomycetospora sp. OC33-EN08]|uniref:MFS transporter n=1 Tax=Actinomycetospora aurantiaca TaxID=3129233 RepID=A0ABU8ML75_9PSEU